ncbi:MAG: acyl-CoA thioesterase [Spirochaetaceae bacterium]|jgi:acyl-CoA thioester hydrolase|nr:acyl-CoA thioesterase [Spirochaetaceae bacterium]
MVKNILQKEIEFNVEFYDCDPMNIVWHGNYIKYFEKARCALLDYIGYGYNEMKESCFAFPVTGVRVKYIAPLRFGDRVKARAILDEYENCIKTKYELYNAETGKLCTKGESTQMAIDMIKEESLFTCPKIFIDKVEAFIK